MTGQVELLSPRRARRRAKSGVELIACSFCLRVLRDLEWQEAERVIREIRSYELETPPRLQSALCDLCAESIRSRRAEAREVAAA